LLTIELAEFGWDSEIELVTLNWQHVTAMLNDFISGHRSAAEIRRWAETIEGREDIALASENAKQLRDAIFELAHPELGYALSPMLARRLIKTLEL